MSGPKRLYTEQWEQFTEEGRHISNEFTSLIKPFLKKCADEGLPIRELIGLLQIDVWSAGQHELIRRNQRIRDSIKKTKAKKAAEAGTVVKDEIECDECDGSGTYTFNGKPQRCICKDVQC